MTASHHTERAVPTIPCPPWCEKEHLGSADDPCGFHHDGEVVAVGLENPEGAVRGDYLFVNVSQREERGELEQPYVEVQDEGCTLALLTPEECVLLAAALLDGARQIEQRDGAVPALVRS